MFHVSPVSYTHLDVYKRQVLTKPEKLYTIRFENKFVYNDQNYKSLCMRCQLDRFNSLIYLHSFANNSQKTYIPLKERGALTPKFYNFHNI